MAIAPGFFSGIAACFVCIPTVAIFFEDGILIPPLVGAVLFGWLSGIFAIILAVGAIRGRHSPVECYESARRLSYRLTKPASTLT